MQAQWHEGGAPRDVCLSSPALLVGLCVRSHAVWRGLGVRDHAAAAGGFESDGLLATAMLARKAGDPGFVCHDRDGARGGCMPVMPKGAFRH